MTKGIDQSPAQHASQRLKPDSWAEPSQTLVKYGPELMLSPYRSCLATATVKRYLSAPDPRYDLPHESGQAAHRETGVASSFSASSSRLIGLLELKTPCAWASRRGHRSAGSLI